MAYVPEEIAQDLVAAFAIYPRIKEIIDAVGAVPVKLPSTYMVAAADILKAMAPLLAVPGIRAALRSTPAPVVGYSPIVDGKPLRGMADECLTVIGVQTSSEAVGRHYGARSATGLLDFWLVHETDHADVPGVTVKSIPLLMSDPAATAAMVRAGLDLAGVAL